jgi:branched-chain amino acid transport system ATP-binding protein
MPILEVKNLSVFYGGIQALCSVSFHVKKGEIVSIIGANGVGKSTLLRSIAGDQKFRQGQIIYDNEPIPAESYKVVQKGISLVPEGRRIFPGLTVMENLMVGAYTRKNKNEFKESLAEIFELFPRLKERQKQFGGSLSGGEQQMLALSRALAARPKLLLLDEPSLGLAPIVIEEVFDKVVEINKEREITVVMVEQNAYVALEIAQRAYVMTTGRIVMEGVGRELLEKEEIVEKYLGAAPEEEMPLR